MKNSAFKFNLKLKTSEQPPHGLRREPILASETSPTASTADLTNFSRELDKVKRRRSFNPNEAAPPRPTDLTRPHSVYRMENQNNNRVQDQPDTNNKTDKERRKSDFLSRYEELTCKAALAIKSVDQIVAKDRNNENNRNEGNVHPLLDSPLTPEVESVEFNEEEVLKTCQDFLEDYDRSKTRGPGPIPAPRLSLTNRVAFPSARHRPASNNLKREDGDVLEVARRPPTNHLSREDEDLLEAAQEKSFWETSSVFEKLDNVNPEAFDSKIIRTRSSSLTIHDKSEEKIKPILKKSTEDLAEHNKFPSILKTRDDFGLNSKTKHEGKSEHVRIRSPSCDRNEHVRIRSPSPDFENETIDLCDDDGRSSSPEVPSILKARFRRTSVDGITFDDLNDGEPQSILKRKSSFGSGSHSPEGNSENTRSILKKSSRNSSRTCSRSGSIEELDVESTKSILKSRNSSRTCSRSGSQEELDLDFDDDWETSRPKSILKKKSGSTDDELDERPKSILKSRRSEESLSPSSDLIDTPSHSILRDGRSSSGTRQSSIISDNEEILVISGRNSPLLTEEAVRRPILKNRDDISAPHSILKKQREKSSSPVGRVCSPEVFLEGPGLYRGRDVTCPAPRRLDRSHPRHLTQPVTSQEVSEAAGLSDLHQAPAASVSERESPAVTPSASPLTSLPPASAQTSQTSLGLSSVARRPARRKLNSARFQTQPITVDEVEMARTRRGGEGSGASSPETVIRPNQFLHSFSVDSSSHFSSSSNSGELQC